MQTIFNSVESFNKAINLQSNTINPEYNGKDVYLTIENKEYKNASLGIANCQNVVNPPKLHLAVKNCTFDGATVEGKQIYLTYGQEVLVENCVFKNNTVSDYGIDINQCSIQGSIIKIKDSTFDSTGIKSAIKISMRKGDTDHPSDITVTTPATISNVIIANCIFANNVCDYTIGTTPKGIDTSANTTTGNYTVELIDNSVMNVKEPYVYNKDVVVEPVEIKAGKTIIKEIGETVTEVNKNVFTKKQIEDLDNMNVAAQRCKLGTVLNESLSGSNTTTVPSATTESAGIVKQASAQADSTATDVETIKNDFNALIAKLKTAGIMAE